MNKSKTKYLYINALNLKLVVRGLKKINKISSCFPLVYSKLFPIRLQHYFPLLPFEYKCSRPLGINIVQGKSCRELLHSYHRELTKLDIMSMLLLPLLLTVLIILSLSWLVLRTLKEGRKALTEINKNRS